MRNCVCLATIVVAVFSFANAQDLFVTPFEHTGPFGQDYTFVCKLTLNSGPAPVLVWMKGTEEIESIPNQYVVMHMSNDEESSAESKLTIKNAQEDDAGSYMCKHGSSQSASVELTVYQDYDVKIEGKSILKEGEDLTFTCTVDGATKEAVVWKKDDKELPVEDRQELKVNNTLVIMDPTVEDAGVYVCIYATADREFTANITVGDPLELQGPNSIKYTEGERARFECTSISKPPPTITWSMENGTLDDRFTVEEKPPKGQMIISSLLLVGVKKSDRGNYICTADNGIDVETHTIMLRVRDRLAALWPFIGIMCEVIILIAIIFIHEKCTQGGDVGDDDDDDEAMEPIKTGAPDDKPNSDGEGDAARMRTSKE